MLGAVASLLLVACSSGSKSPSTTAATSATVASGTASGCGSSGQGSTTLTAIDRRSCPNRHRARPCLIQRVDQGSAGPQHARKWCDGSGPRGLHRHGRDGRCRRVHRGLSSRPHRRGHRLRLERPQRAAHRREERCLSDAPDDVTFLTDLVGVLEHRYCIDSTQVYATGFSGGARMASQLACDASNVFAAVAPVSGLRRPTPCPASRPVPVIAFHGTADPVDPYNGNGQAYWTYSVPQAARRSGPNKTAAPPCHFYAAGPRRHVDVVHRVPGRGRGRAQHQ